MRGLACVLMFQTHCYDSWLGGAARNSSFLMWSQLGGTLPAPLFLFLAGISFAFVADKLVRKNLSGAEITSAMARRGAEIFAFGLLFRLQEFLIAWGWAPKSDLARVDILNTIGLSMMLMALVSGFVLGAVGPRSPQTALVAASVSAAALIALLTPPSGRPRVPVGFPGRSSPISTAATIWARLNPGCSQFSLDRVRLRRPGHRICSLRRLGACPHRAGNGIERRRRRGVDSDRTLARSFVSAGLLGV